MFTIAGGIILAFVILANLDKVIYVGAYILAITLVGGSAFVGWALLF